MKNEPDLTHLSASQGTIRILEKRGMSLTEIATLLDVSKSFISRVRSGTRSFTLQHLSAVSVKLDIDLPMLLMEALDPSTLKPENRKLYNMTKRLLERTSPKRKKRSKAA